MFDGPAENSQAHGDWAVPGVDRGIPPAPEALPPVLVALQAAAEAIRDWHPDALDEHQALASTAALLGIEKLVAAARIRSLTDVDARRLHRLDDAPTTGRWVRRQGFDLPAADLTLARGLAALPLVADELASGRLGVASAKHLRAALTRLRPHVDRPDGLIDGQDAEQALVGVLVDGVRQVVCQARGGFSDDADPVLVAMLLKLQTIAAAPVGELARLEAAFLVLAEHVEPGQLRELLAVLVDALLPAQLEERARRGELERGLRLTRTPNGWHLEGDLDLECGEQLHTVLTAELHRDDAAPADTERAAALRSQGLDPYDRDLDLPDTRRPRSRRERMHDALRHALGRYLAADLGGVHDKAPVQLLVTVGTHNLDRAPGALPAVGASGARLPTGLVRRWGCGSALTRLVLSLAGRVIEVSHTGRTLKAHERRALHAQTGGVCQAAGCYRSTADPTAVLHPHHADPWASSGRTSLADTALICDSDHEDVHHGHIVTLKDGRRLGPDGWAA